MIDTFMDWLNERMVSAYRAKEADAEPEDDKWQQNLMRAIRQIGPLRDESDNRAHFGQLAWRLAPAALVLTIALAVLIIRLDNTLNYQIAGLLVNDPVQTEMTYTPF